MNKKTILTVLSGMAVMLDVLPASSALRAPAYPLVTIDPYTSAWSMTDNLYDEEVKHWTETSYPLIGVAMVDGEAYRFMGKEIPWLETILPTASGGGWTCRYTTSQPSDGWFGTDFNDSSWSTGEGAFGSVPEEQLAITAWRTPKVWVRRDFSLPAYADGKPLYLNYSHDDDAVIYINGIKIVDTGNACHKDVRVELPQEVIESLRPEGNVIAAYCYDRGGRLFLISDLNMRPINLHS